MFVAVSLAGFFAIAELWPDITQQASQVYSWLDDIDNPMLLAPLVIVIIVAEEAIWRGAVMLPLAARLGHWRGVFLSAALFAVAHVFIGPLLLVLAAFVAGTFWGWLAIKMKGLFAPIVSHVVWDATLLFIWPVV